LQAAKAYDCFLLQLDTRVQFYKWFNELADKGLILRYPGYEQGSKLPPPDQVFGNLASHCTVCPHDQQQSTQHGCIDVLCCQDTLIACPLCAIEGTGLHVLQSLLELQRQP
jgi:hypothetical protein